MLKILQGHIDLGLSLIWIKPKSKAPTEMNWTSRPKKHYNDLLKTYKPDYNLGVRLGEPSRLNDGSYLAVIDCDLKSENPIHKDELLKSLEELPFDWTECPRVLSGRGNGSFHIYIKTEKPLISFRYKSSHHKEKVFMPSAKASSRDLEGLSGEEITQGYRLRNAWEVDFIGTGKQVVLPPSTHPDSGKKYQWSTAEGLQIDRVALINPELLITTDDSSKKKEVKGFEYTPCEVDLISSRLRPEMIEMIISGKGLEKYDGDSEALFASVLAMLGTGFSNNEICSVLSDQSFYLGQVAPRHTESTNPKRWAKWIHDYNIIKARLRIDKDRGFDTEAIETKISDNEAIEQTKALKPRELWKSGLEVNDNGTVKPCIRNIKLILEFSNDQNCFAYNDFTKEITFNSTPAWATVNTKYRGRAVNDGDISTIRVWLSSHFRCEAATSALNDVVNDLAFKNYSHPVRDYLCAVKWDGLERLDIWLKDYLNATGDDKYLAAIGRKTLVAAVARIFEPASKFDQVLILEGTQGVGKSTALRYLASDEWFTDQLGDISNKDALDKMRGVWIIELGELASFNKNEVERLKEFISATTDRFRPAYGRRTLDFPRQCIFIGTTNNTEYLRDTTGNRRFWPVQVGKVDMNRIKADRDQLWAEAYHYYQEGEKLYIDDTSLTELIIQQQTMRESVDDFTIDIWDKICDWAEAEEGRSVDRIPADDLYNTILSGCLLSTQSAKKIQYETAQAMRVLGYERTVAKVRNDSRTPWKSKRIYRKVRKNIMEV